jgi:hypothetical protein
LAICLCTKYIYKCHQVRDSYVDGNPGVVDQIKSFLSGHWLV